MKGGIAGEPPPFARICFPRSGTMLVAFGADLQRFRERTPLK